MSTEEITEEQETTSTPLAIQKLESTYPTTTNVHNTHNTTIANQPPSILSKVLAERGTSTIALGLVQFSTTSSVQA